MSEEEQRRLEAEVLGDPSSLEAWVALSRFLARGGVELRAVRVEDHLDRLEGIFSEQPADRTLWDLIRPAWDREMVWLCETPAPQTNWKIPRSRRLKQFLARLPENYQLEFLLPYLDGPDLEIQARVIQGPQDREIYRERERLYRRQSNMLDLAKRVVRGRKAMFRILRHGLQNMPFPRELFPVVVATVGERRFLAMAREIHSEAPELLGGRWTKRAAHRLRLSEEGRRAFDEILTESRRVVAPDEVE